MVYECDECGAVLSARMTRCPGCGEEFDAPVPSEAIVPEDVRVESRIPSIESRSPSPVPKPRNPLKVVVPPESEPPGIDESAKSDAPQASSLPEKICPQCSLILPLGHRTCWHCGHRFRTRYHASAGGVVQAFDPQSFDSNRTQMFMNVPIMSVPISDPKMQVRTPGFRAVPPPHGPLRARRNKRVDYQRWMLIGLGLLLCAGAAYTGWDLFW